MLPVTEIPTHKVKLPILKKQVTVRAMLAAEEKILLTAKDANASIDEMNNTILNLIKACVMDKKIDTSKMTIPDLVAIFIGIISISKGARIEHRYRCTKQIDDGECNTFFSVNVDLNDVKFTSGNDSDMLELSPNLYVQMKYPDTDLITEISDSETSDIDKMFNICGSCIVSIIDAETTYSDFSKEEIIDWIKQLPISYYNKIKNFLENTPSAYLEYDVTCPNCGNTKKVTLRNLADFFTHDTGITPS